MASDPLPFNLHDQLEPLECNSRQTRRGSASPQSAHTSSFFIILGRTVDQAGLTASFRAHVNIVSLLTYLLIYLFTVPNFVALGQTVWG